MPQIATLPPPPPLLPPHPMAPELPPPPHPDFMHTANPDTIIDLQPLPTSKTALVQRAHWLRAAILGANDGLLSVSTLMLGVGSAKDDRWSMLVSGAAGSVAGAFSMALGEFVSVSAQRDIQEEANKNGRSQQLKLVNVVKIKDPVELQSPWKSPTMGAIAASKDEEEALPSPAKAAAASGLAFMVGSAVPLLSSGFVWQYKARIMVLVAVSTVALAGFGWAAAYFGGSRRVRLSTLRVLVGGWLAMGITYCLFKLLDIDDI